MREPIIIKCVEDVRKAVELWGVSLSLGGYGSLQIALLELKYGPVPPGYCELLKSVQIDQVETSFQFYSPGLMPSFEPNVQVAFDYHEDTIGLVECASVEGAFISICFDEHRFGKVFQNYVGYPFPGMELLGRDFCEFFFLAVQIHELSHACVHGDDLLARFAKLIEDLPIELQANWYAHGEVLLLT